MILSNALVAQSAPPPIYSVCDAINRLQPLKDSRISVQGLLDPNRFLLTHSQCWVPGKPIPEPRAITLREARGTAPYAGLREVSGKAVEVGCRRNTSAFTGWVVARRCKPSWNTSVFVVFALRTAKR